ncbi:hypothetical protein ACTXT7_015453, partial [Hymenolepis weldensis]
MNQFSIILLHTIIIILKWLFERKKFLPYELPKSRPDFEPDLIRRGHLDKYSNKYTDTPMRLDILFSWSTLRKFPRQAAACPPPHLG